jgi:hypothetical protein
MSRKSGNRFSAGRATTGHATTPNQRIPIQPGRDVLQDAAIKGANRFSLKRLHSERDPGKWTHRFSEKILRKQKAGVECGSNRIRGA